MKTLHNIVSTLNNIQNTSSSNDKMKIFRKYYDRLSTPNAKLFKTFLNMVYSPYYTYNISSLNEMEKKQLGEILVLNKPNLKIILDTIMNDFVIDKIRGNEAKEILLRLYQSCNNDGRYIVESIIGRDLKCGFNINSINKVIVNCIPIGEYMGAVPFKGWDDLISRTTIGYMVQTKADGLFAFSKLKEVISKNQNALMSRNMKNIPILFPSLIKDFKALKKSLNIEATLHGELLIDGIDRLTANGIFRALVTIQNKSEVVDNETIVKLKRKFKETVGYTITEIQKKIRYTVWDATWGGSHSFTNIDRFSRLKDAIEAAGELKHISLIPNILIPLGQEIEIVDIFEKRLKNGEEGLIVKIPEEFFKNGKSQNCIKFKNEFENDYKVVGFEEGKNSNVGTLGAIMISSEDGKVLSKCSGFTDVLKDEIWNNQDKYLNTIVEVEATDVTSTDNETFSLMHPRFKDFKTDKDIADTLEQIFESRNSFGYISKLEKSLNEIQKDTSYDTTNCQS